MKIKVLILFLLALAATNLRAQELNCQIEINFSQVQGTTNKQIFDQLKRSILEFMNSTKWTNDVYTNQEKIDCSFLIVIDKSLGADQYSGSIQVTSNRPVYKSSYSSRLVNVEDDEFQFKFQQFTQITYNINTFQDNLTSVLQFYAYVVIASDYDSYAPLGGTPYWQKAQLIVQNAQNAPESGWRQNDQKGNRNRYWLVENTLQPLFKGIRDCNYEYCRNGLDKMHENIDEARANVLKALNLLLPVYSARPASFNMQLFFNAKREELIDIFKGATPEEKTKVLEILSTVDPAGTTRYSKIQGS
jgi:hypothetical protein